MSACLPSNTTLTLAAPCHSAMRLLGGLGDLVRSGGCLPVQRGQLSANDVVLRFRFGSVSTVWLRYPLCGWFAARHARAAPEDTARFLLLADDGAQWPGHSSGTSPIAPVQSPGRLGHRAALRWPRQEGERHVA